MTHLDDDSAIRILKNHRAGPAPTMARPISLPNTELLGASLAALYNGRKTQSPEGDLARTALDVLAQDPQFADPVRIMSRESPASRQRFADATATIARRNRRSGGPSDERPG